MAEETVEQGQEVEVTQPVTPEVVVSATPEVDAQTVVECAEGESELWGVCYSIELTNSLDLSNKNLSGEIPINIGNLTNLTSLDLSNNAISGRVPDIICDMSNITHFSIHNNQLCPPFPFCLTGDNIGYQEQLNCIKPNQETVDSGAQLSPESPPIDNVPVDISPDAPDVNTTMQEGGAVCPTGTILAADGSCIRGG